MKMIAGLGNPGAEYAQTKHNVGFMLVDALAAYLGAGTWREDFSAYIAEVRIGSEKVFLVKPQTYMNSSGESLGPMLSYYKMDCSDLIVVHDDMDIPAGTTRIRKKGGSGGHNGIKSIIAHTGSENFVRVRIGIGRPPAGWTVIHHVLAPFSAEDAAHIRAAIDFLLPAVTCIVQEGADLAMNRYNPQRKKNQKQEGRHEAEQETSSAAAPE
ncbi:aminoacyl-tRNA hydrolase [uncultured Selenomonas sp.]|uniref:aminoacyl-tRNA hydrolase n=1 Tax=uncultured Selenomonas sp. TaxID=159275 RepID=UPI0028D3EBC5|nr:aminoacyl-tRNA hydrolase [uncultured Selenomonas sp.]